eukprot:10630157-Alexandrium_andersonii.AAC.1
MSSGSCRLSRMFRGPQPKPSLCRCACCRQYAARKGVLASLAARKRSCPALSRPCALCRRAPASICSLCPTASGPSRGRRVGPCAAVRGSPAPSGP